MNEIEQGVPLNEQGEGLLEPSPQADTEQALNSITPLMEIGATDGDDSEDTVPDDAKNYVEAPFNYNHDSHEHVPLNSGTFSYTVTDLALPGKNGLDLVIKRRYDTTQASSYEFARGFRKTTTLQRKRKKPYLGIGWCLDLPWIEHSQSGLYPRFLHLEDGRKLSVKKLSSGVYLRHYKLKDMQLTQEGYHVYVHGEQVNYAYRLDLKDGKSHYFDRDGLIVATIDRFGNQLRYILSEHGAVLIDTYGRKLTLSYAEIPTYEGGKDYSGTPPITVIPIEVPDPERPVAKSWEYTGTYTWNGLPSNHTITYRCENGYLVHSTDQCGQTTGYEYGNMAVYGNMNPVYDHYGDTKIVYVTLTGVVHPTGARSAYAFKPVTIQHGYALESDDEGNRYDAYSSSRPKIFTREDVEADGTVQGKLYYQFATRIAEGKTYVLLATTSHVHIPEAEDLLDNMTGFKPRTQFPGIVTKESLYTCHKFNPKGFRELEQTFLDADLISEKVFGYNYDLELPSEERQTKPFAKTTRWEYDNQKFGDLIREEVTAGGVTKVTNYEYNQNYHYVTKKTYQKDDATTIEERYLPYTQVPELDRLVGEVRILENGVLTRLKKYGYTGFQLTQEQDYHGDLAREDRYVYKSYAYTQSCPRPTSITYGTWYTPSHGHPVGVGDIATERFVYDFYGRETEQTDLNGHRTRKEYDAIGRLAMETQPNGASKSYAYIVGISRNQISCADERGHKKLLTYTSLGKIKEEYDDTAKLPVAGYEYDQFGRRVLETRYDPDTPGLVKTTTTIGYDHLDRELDRRIQDRTGGILYSESSFYNDYNLLHAKTVNGQEDAPSVTTTVTKDPWGQVIRESRGNTGMTYTCDKLGNRRSQTDAAGNITRWEYTFDGQVKKETNALGHSAEVFYNALGQKEYSVDPLGHRTDYYYNGLGHLTRQISEFDENGPAEIAYTCDYLGNVLSKQVRRSHGTEDWSETRYKYDQCGRLTHTVTDDSGKGSCTKFEYNAAGDKTKVVIGIVCGSFADWESTMPTLGSQPATTYDYDHLGNMILTRDPQNQTERYAYDALGRLRRKTDRNGGVTTYTYDALDRLIREEAGESAWRALSYYRTGAKASESNPALTSTFRYDHMGRLTGETEGGVEKTHSYDNRGNRTGFLLKRNGVTELHLTYEYDKLNRLQWVMRPTNDPNLTQIIAEYRYNRGGSREKLIRYGGKQITTDYLYNAASLVTSLTNKRGEEVLSAYAYTYYPDGNQKSKTSTVRGERKTVYYEYDAMGRLTCEREDGGRCADYTYDALSNRKQMKVTGAGRFDYTTTYDCDSLCRLLEERKVSADATETVSYQYDQNGNQTRRIWQRVGKKGTVPGGIHLSHGPADDNCMVEYRSYNAMGEMTRLWRDGRESLYAYRPDGLRHRKTSEGVTTLHLWDGQDIVAEYTENGSRKARYTRGVGLLSQRIDEGEFFYLHNAHGDVVQRTDFSGSIAKTYDYDAFGVEEAPDQTDPNPFRYCGEYFDKESETVYLRARSYRPSTGRFTSEDIARDGINWYTYCGNDPVGFVDPSGLAFAPAAPVVVEGLDVLFNLFILALGLEAASSGPKAQPLDPGIFGDVLGDIAIGTIGAVGGDSVLQITKFVSDIQTKAKDNTERFKESKGKYQLGFIFNGELIRSHKKHDIMEAYGILSTGQIASDVLGGALPQIASFLGIDVSSITNKEYNDFINDLHWGVYTNNQMDAKLLAETLGLDHHDDAPSLGKYAEIHGDGHYQHYHSKLKGGTSVHIWYGGKKLLR